MMKAAQWDPVSSSIVSVEQRVDIPVGAEEDGGERNSDPRSAVRKSDRRIWTSNRGVTPGSPHFIYGQSV